MASSPSPTPPAPGILDSIRSFVATWVALIKTRVELLSVEVEEQREWLEYLLIRTLAATFCICLGLVLLTLFIVMCFWESYRLWVLGGFSLLYLGGGIGLMLAMRSKAKSRPRFFENTAAELAKDHAYLQPRSP